MSLHTESTKIYNNKNEEVVLNGISTMTLFGYEDYPPVYPALYTPDDVSLIRSHGLNLMRLEISLNTALYGVPPSQQTPTKLVYNPEFFPTLDALVSRAKEEGVFLNILFIQSTGAMAGMSGLWGEGVWGEGNGLPRWFYDGSWSYFNKIYAHDGVGASDAIRDFWNLQNPVAENLRTAYKTFWRDMAEHFKFDQNVIFGLWNEPQIEGFEGAVTIWGGEGQPTQAEGAMMYKTFMEQTIDVIRAIAPRHILFVNLCYLWYWEDNLKIERENVVVEGHRYAPVDSDFINLGWRYNQPFFLGEFGGIEENLQTREDTIANMQFCNTLDVSRSYLSYRPLDGYPTPQTWTDLETYLSPNIRYYSFNPDPTPPIPWLPIALLGASVYYLTR